MKRIITCLLSAIVSLGTYAQFADGYYRLQCKETGRYLAVHNNYVNTGSATRTGQVYLQSLETISGFENIVNDPGSVLYLRNTSKGYVIDAQGFTTDGRNMFLEFVQVDDAYRLKANITYEGQLYPRYLRDYEEEPGYSYLTTDANQSTNWNWYVIPVTEADNQYLGLKGDVKVGNSYFTTLYAAFPVKLGNNMKAYAVNSLTENSCTLKDIGDIVPTKCPVVIECAGETADANKVTPLPASEATISDNRLNGIIFCYPVIVGGKEKRSNPAWNATDYAPATMRLLGETDGKLCFNTSSEVKYLPANKAFLPVNAGSAASIPTDGTTGISKVTTNSYDPQKAKATYTINGVRLPDNMPLQKGIYIQDGKKVVIK